jgi:hypothetical protein
MDGCGRLIELGWKGVDGGDHETKKTEEDAGDLGS